MGLSFVGAEIPGVYHVDMLTRIFEAQHPHGMGNWGKFLVGIPYSGTLALAESVVDKGQNLLRSQGWGRTTIFVFDLATGEGAFFGHGGYAPGCLNKKKIRVCPLFEPFLTWLYRQPIEDLWDLPSLVELDAPFSVYGYRRQGRPEMLPVLNGCKGSPVAY